MQSMTFTDLVGMMIVGAATMRAAFGLISIAGRRYQFHKQEKEYIAQFQNMTSPLFKTCDEKQAGAELLWRGKRKFRLAERVDENQNGDICSFYLMPNDGRPIPPFCAGQHLTFDVPVPGDTEPITRCYSLSGSPTEKDSYCVTVKRIGAPQDAPPGTPPGQSSNYFHDHLEQGSVIEAYAPAGSFCLKDNSETPIILIAGGVGLTPLVSMLKWLDATKSTREIWFFYGVRNRAEHAMYDYLHSIALETPNLHMVVAYSQPTSTCRKNIDYHIEGHLSAALLQPILKARDCEIYLCGPASMMSALTAGLEGLGVARENIRYEAFGPISQTAVARNMEQYSGEPAKSVNVEFSRSGKTLKWSPEDGSLLELALDNGIKARCGCRQGICGTCVTAIKHGDVEYERRPDKKPALGMCLPCIARPQGDLVLDM